MVDCSRAGTAQVYLLSRWPTRSRRTENNGKAQTGHVSDIRESAARQAAPATLRAALGDPDPRVRAAVAWLLPVFKGEAAVSVPLIMARLKDPDADVRRVAGEALSRFGPAAKDATPALLEALSDPDENYSNDE